MRYRYVQSKYCVSPSFSSVVCGLEPGVLGRVLLPPRSSSSPRSHALEDVVVAPVAVPVLSPRPRRLEPEAEVQPPAHRHRGELDSKLELVREPVAAVRHVRALGVLGRRPLVQAVAEGDPLLEAQVAHPERPRQGARARGVRPVQADPAGPEDVVHVGLGPGLGEHGDEDPEAGGLLLLSSGRGGEGDWHGGERVGMLLLLLLPVVFVLWVVELQVVVGAPWHPRNLVEKVLHVSQVQAHHVGESEIDWKLLLLMLLLLLLFLLLFLLLSVLLLLFL